VHIKKNYYPLPTRDTFKSDGLFVLDFFTFKRKEIRIDEGGIGRIRVKRVSKDESSPTDFTFLYAIKTFSAY